MRSEAMGPMERQTRAAIERLTTPALVGMPVTLSPDVALTTGRIIEGLAKLADSQAVEARHNRCALLTLLGIVMFSTIMFWIGYSA